jgi:hypothetical protein
MTVPSGGLFEYTRRPIFVSASVHIILLIIQVYHLKCHPTTVTYYGTKVKSKAGPLPCNKTLPASPMTLRSRSPWLHKSRADADMVYSETECILKHYFALKLFAAVCEAFSNMCLDKEVPNKTVH